MRVGVIGGGWAGLAAAVTLAEQQVPVTLFESAAQLGGRARRITRHGQALDNGQHILIGAYQETLRIMTLVGVNSEDACYAPALTLQILPNFKLQATALPAPWHLGVGLLRCQGITFSEKLSAMRCLLTLKRQRFHVDQTLSVSALLQQQRQSSRLNNYLWHPLCLAALNTPPTQASAQVFVNVLRDAFFTTRDASRLILPRVDLGTLFPDAAAHYLHAHGGLIKHGQRIRRIAVHTDTFTLHHAQASENFTHVVCAVGAFHVHQLLGHLSAMHSITEPLASWSYQPIYTVYLQYDASARLPFPMLGMSNGVSQWVFDRRLTQQPGLLAVIISAQGEHEKYSHAMLAQQIQDDLRQQFGITAQPHWTQVIAEKRATFSCTPNLRRPANLTPVPSLYLAGDYTASDYPATLEAAVRSGVNCARLILSSLTSH